MRFEVVPSALYEEALRIQGLPHEVRQTASATASAVGGGAQAAGGRATGAGIEYFGTRLGHVLGQFEATLGGTGTAAAAAAARYEATDRNAMRGR
jgi:hypothetical protein